MALALKVTEFRPEYAGQLHVYRSLLSEQVRKPHEPPSIGSSICQRTVGEFARRDINNRRSA